jgi:hypothetical protein
VTAKHIVGPAQNGHDGCHARLSHSGICPGVKIAEWLNSLGEDDAPYGSLKRVTNGEVRDNYLRSDQHVVAVEPERARLLEAQRQAQRSLRIIKQRLRQLDRQLERV